MTSMNISESTEESMPLNNRTDYEYYYNYGGVLPNIFDYMPRGYSLARRILFTYVNVTIWIVSLLGNLLIVWVLTRKRTRNFSTSVYLIGLAVADFGLNTSNNLIVFLNHQGLLPRANTTLYCQFRNLFPFAISFIAGWMLVVISVERAISVSLPHKVKSVCTVSVARVVIAVMWTSVFGLSILHERVYVYEGVNGYYACYMNLDIYEIYVDYIMWLLVCLKFLIPYGVIFTCTIMIMVRVFKSKQMKSSTKKGVQNSVNVVLMNVNIVFLFTHFPYIFFFLYGQYTKLHPDGLLDYLYFTFWVDALRILSDSNSAVNIFVYFLSGSRFRNDLKKMLFSSCKRKVSARPDTFSVPSRASLGLKQNKN